MSSESTTLPFAAFDADNHYYEAEDAFIRHVDPKMHKRCMQWAQIDGRQRLLVGGKVNRFIPNPTFDPVARPGCLDDYFRGKVAKSDMREAFGELVPIPDEYRDRDARIAVMDQQGLEACFMFPTLGVGMESALEGDVDATLAAFDGFNKWLDDDWGFAYQNRIITAGYITLADPDWALDQLDWMLDRDVRVVNMRPSSVLGRDGRRRSLGDPAFDAVLEEDGRERRHARDAQRRRRLCVPRRLLGGERRVRGLPSERVQDAAHPLADQRRPRLAHRRRCAQSNHRNIRVCTIETGSEWVQPLLKKFEKTYKMQKHAFAEDPIEVFARQVWVSPYYEDDLHDLKAKVGAEHMLFGSDWPHAEGLPNPVDFVDDLDGFDSAEIELIMRDNGLSLAQRAV